MNEFGITKIMDGIFISDLSLIHDFQFLISNKVSHIIMWTASQDYINFQQSGISTLKFIKNGTQGLLPQQTSQLIKIINFVQQSKQQCLCCLICSDFQSQAAMLISVYFMKKYLWDLNTVFRYIGLRFYQFNPRVQIVQQLQDFQLYLQINEPSIKLKQVQFTYQFLSTYYTDDFDQKFLINTIKNTLLDKFNCFTQSHNNNNNNKTTKKRKRLQWFDKLRPSSSLASFNSKYTIYNRNSSLKSKNKLLPQNKQNMIKLSSNGFQNIGLKSNLSIGLQDSIKGKKLQKKSSSQMINIGQFIMDDLQYESLKQLSRCKMTQSRYKGTLRKSGSLRIIRGDKVKKRDQIVKIYNKDIIGVKNKKLQDKKLQDKNIKYNDKNRVLYDSNNKLDDKINMLQYKRLDDKNNILKSLKCMTKLKLGLNA